MGAPAEASARGMGHKRTILCRRRGGQGAASAEPPPGVTVDRAVAQSRDVLFSAAVPRAPEPPHRAGAMGRRGSLWSLSPSRSCPRESLERERHGILPRVPRCPRGHEGERGQGSRVWGSSLFPRPEPKASSLTRSRCRQGGEETLCPSVARAGARGPGACRGAPRGLGGGGPAARTGHRSGQRAAFAERLVQNQRRLNPSECCFSGRRASPPKTPQDRMAPCREGTLAAVSAAAAGETGQGNCARTGHRQRHERRNSVSRPGHRLALVSGKTSQASTAPGEGGRRAGGRGCGGSSAPSLLLTPQTTRSSRRGEQGKRWPATVSVASPRAPPTPLVGRFKSTSFCCSSRTKAPIPSEGLPSPE